MARRAVKLSAEPKGDAAQAGGGFLARTRLKKAGGSLVMTVPASARNLLQLTEGQEMLVTVEDNKVVMEPLPPDMAAPRVRRPKYSLEQLLEGMELEDGGAWLDAPPAGRETW